MKRKMLKTIAMIVLLIPIITQAQEIAVKTNLLYAATTTPNLSLEWAPSRKISLELQGSYNGWEFGKSERNRKIKHWLIQPEVRFWIYEAFDGHFLGIHPFYGQYNTGNIHLPLRIYKGWKDHRYEGYATGLGFSYGYQWYLGHHWNLEFEFGFGYAYLNYDRYNYKKCSPCLGSDHKHYFGPTKLGLSVAYLFKSKKTIIMKTTLLKISITWMAIMYISHLYAQSIPQVDGAVIMHNTKFEQVATRLTLSFEAEVIEKAMNYRQSWTIIPELISADGEKSRIYPTILINGTQKERHYKRRMRYKNKEMLANEPMIRVKAPQDTTQVITYSADIPYESWMNDATLTLHQVLTSSREKKQLFTTDNIARVSPEKIIVEKIKETPVTPFPEPKPTPSGIFAAEGSSYVQFPINESDIRRDFMNNLNELGKIEKDIQEIIFDKNYTLLGIYLTGYASPEGRYGFNEYLSQARTQALKEHIVNKYGISADQIWVNSIAEDWNRLREMIAKSDLADKSSIIAIIDSAETPDVKEKRLRALGNTWRTLLKDYFPNLRRVDYQLLYQKP